MQTNPSTKLDRRIALYGGAFDPVHKAHLGVANAALQQAGLSEVIFIPSAQSPLKDSRPRTSAEDRVAMLRIALAPTPAFRLDLSELEAGGMSYTIETVQRMHEAFPEHPLFWILGGDQLAQLDRWHRIEELVKLVTFLAVARPDAAAPAQIPGLRYESIHCPLMSESSSQVRDWIAAGKSVDDLLPDGVAAFIDRRGLYK